MALKMQQSYHHSVAVKVNEHQMGTKRGYTFIQANRTWLPKVLLLWVMAMALFSLTIYNGMDADNRVRRKEVLGSMCDQRARMLQDQFSVSVNHVHALAILVSTFHYYKNPSAIDQVHRIFKDSMATISQQTGKRRVNFMRKIDEGNRVTRAMSFSKRKPTLKKKVGELKTLCAVTICMVCFGPDGTVETFPENAEEVKKEIMFYKGLHAMQKREFNLLGYLEHGKRKFELKKQKLKRKKLEVLTESLSNQIEGLCGDPLLYFTDTLEKKLVGLREKISLLCIRDDKGKAIADDNDNDHAKIFGESLVPYASYVPEPITASYVPEPIDAWPAMDANNNIVRVENNNTLSSKCALSLVDEDLPMSFWDSELLNLVEIKFQPCSPQK